MSYSRLRIVVVLFALVLAGVVALVVSSLGDDPDRPERAKSTAASGDVTTTAAPDVFGDAGSTRPAYVDPAYVDPAGEDSTVDGQLTEPAAGGSVEPPGGGASNSGAPAPAAAAAAPPAPASGPVVDRSSPLLARFDEQFAMYLEYGGMRSESADLARLTADTGVAWNRDMLLAMAATFCAAEWEVNQERSPMSLAARIAWADGSASAVGVSQDAARRAVSTGVIFQYVSLCPA